MNLRSRLDRIAQHAPDLDPEPEIIITRYVVGADGSRGEWVYRRNTRTGEVVWNPDRLGAKQP